MAVKCSWSLIVLISAAIISASSAQAAPQQQTPPPAKAPATSPASTPAPRAAEEGQRIFAANCSRCHATPEGFPPSITGTVVRHMRVRASLSEHDEKELLRFFNP